ncbi:MAG: prepilin-type N-terminal cleavage/methylation domain-containing protein [Planctomycetota bacterium]|nr:MAG: prepilin-type N-terminal cleavage/methylation domain-containing protein [Planctomycetota bacterium]
MKAKSGFTLVEILIVVVILGILAAIVIPQFTSASTEAKESALVSDLQSVRSQIELYKIHHNDNVPGTQGETFVVAMTSLTNQDGVVDTSGGTDPAYRFGPYMREIPINPFNDLNTVSEGATAIVGQGDDSTGWHVVTSGVDAGLFQANDDDANPLDATDWHTGY